MKERPIIFSPSSVEAILDGAKTQTRRLLRPQPLHVWGSGVSRLHDPRYFCAHVQLPGQREYVWVRCPYGKVGDRLWVREPHTYADTDGEDKVQVHYQAGAAVWWCEAGMDAAEAAALWIERCEVDGDGDNWRQAIHMPRWASRLTLSITGLRVQRLREITEQDAIAEGCDGLHFYRPATVEFIVRWDKLNGKRRGCAWDDDPWVWVVEFERLKREHGNHAV